MTSGSKDKKNMKYSDNSDANLKAKQMQFIDKI
jgi:hypothetical protein